MEDDDLDLSAWAAPPAPSDLADRVIARVTATDAVAVAAHKRVRTRRVYWLAGGLVATLAAAAIVAVVVLTRSPEPGTTPESGAILATRPQQLSFPGAVANLDPSASVSWQLAGTTLHVQQRSGAVTWRVDKPHLFLDVGAAVASIEASNATLRVETRMNLTDARVIGAAAVTSAVVALVTVSVYEGQAELSSAGQTVVVQPGRTYQVAPGKPPTVHVTVGDKPIADNDKNVVTMTVGGAPPASDRTAVRPAPEPGITAAEFEAVMAGLEPSLERCVKQSSSGQDVAVSIAANGSVTDVLTTDSVPATDACLRKVLRKAAFPKTNAASRHTHHVGAPCNADDLLTAGTAAVARGEHARALKSYDAALRCKYDIHTLQLSFFAACRANQVDYARKYWKRMTPDMKTHLLQVCLHEHITQEILDE